MAGPFVGVRTGSHYFQVVLMTVQWIKLTGRVFFFFCLYTGRFFKNIFLLPANLAAYFWTKSKIVLQGKGHEFIMGIIFSILFSLV